MHLLITRHDKIGDFITTLPMIQLAKKQIKDVTISVLVSKINADLAKNIDFIDEVIVYEPKPFAMAKILRAKNIDASISAYIDTKLGVALFLSSIAQRYGPATKLAQLFFNKRIKQRRSRVQKTEVQYNIDLLQSLQPGISREFSRPLLDFSKSKRQKTLQEFQSRYDLQTPCYLVGFHPGFGGSSDGNLSLDDYLKLARSISDKRDVQVIFTFGPDDMQSKAYIEKKLDFDAIIYESTGPLTSFAALLSNFDLFVSTSTGPMHLAAAVNTETISFFGDNLFASSRRWAPVNDPKKQHNFMLNTDYTTEDVSTIINTLKECLCKK